MNFKDYFHDIYLEAFENATNFLTDPANKGKTMEMVVKEFIADGGERLGSGVVGTAFTHPKWNYVLKTFYSDSCYIKFVRFCQKNQDLPMFPKFIGPPQRITPTFTRHLAQDQIYVIRMENLIPLGLSGKDASLFSYVAENAIEKMKEQFDKKEPINGRFIDEISEGEPEVISMLKGVRLLLYADFFTGKKCQMDFHSGNVMLRKDGQWVITDPVIPYYLAIGGIDRNRHNRAKRELETFEQNYERGEPSNVPSHKIISGDTPLNRKQRREKRDIIPPQERIPRTEL